MKVQVNLRRRRRGSAMDGLKLRDQVVAAYASGAEAAKVKGVSDTLLNCKTV